MSTHYIYPAWLSAKLKLIRALEERTDKETIAGIVTDFFENHMFELGVSHRVSRKMMESSNIDMKKEVEYLAERKFGKEIFERGLYYKTERPSFHENEFVFGVLVFGAPKMVGPGTHPAKVRSLAQQNNVEGD